MLGRTTRHILSLIESLGLNVGTSNTKEYNRMDENQREGALEDAVWLMDALRDLRTDLRTMSDKIVATQWELVQANIDALCRSMEDG